MFTSEDGQTDKEEEKEGNLEGGVVEGRVSRAVPEPKKMDEQEQGAGVLGGTQSLRTSEIGMSNGFYHRRRCV